MEYVADRGSFADLPFEEIMKAFAACYGHIAADAGRDRDELFDPRREAPAPGT
jgi:hypothetical protein